MSERELETLFVQIGPLENLPSIYFDRSGRSRGTARLSYTTEDHAAKAVEAFNGALAKGQEIKVEFDYQKDPIVIEPGSLLARLQEDPLRKSFQTRPSTQPPRDAPREPRSHRGGAPSGPTRGGGGARGGGAGRGGKAAPKTSDDLDKELEDFMSAPAAVVGEGVQAGKSDDVEMS